jgi:hypothetical protein
MSGRGRGSNVERSALDKFLTPEAMLTPGAAGGTTMLIANALANNFGLPPSYIGLLLSFLFGLLVLASARELWLRVIYYVLNSLIIFCIAFGSGNLIASNGNRTHGFLSIFAPAYAAVDSTGELQKLRDEYTKLDAEHNNEVAKLSSLQKNGAPQSDIDKQNSLINDLQQKIAANLRSQVLLLEQQQRNEVVQSTPGVSQSSFFNTWTNPFKF